MALDDRIEGTCAWTTRSVPYQTWQNDARSSIFWITGPAGTGKTILCSYLINLLGVDPVREAEDKVKDLTLVCGFFCVKDDQSRRDACAIIQGLLLRIFIQRRDVLKKVKDTFGSSIRQFERSIDTWWRIFSFAIRTARCQTLYVVIDALDECEERSKKKLLDQVAETLQEWNDKDSTLQRRVKFIITGDPQVVLSQKLMVESSNQYRLNIEDCSQDMENDVERVVNKRVDDLVDRLFCTAQQGDKLKSSLRRHAENSFLWVTVVLTYIEQSIAFDPGHLRQILVDPPKDLNDAFCRYFPRVSEQSISLFKKLIHAMVASSRPLSLEELNVFVMITYQQSTYAIEEDKQIHMEVVLRKAFGPMIRIVDSKVHFIHSSVKDFLLNLHRDSSHPLHATHAVDLQSAHLTLASACVRYLLLNDFKKPLFNNDSASKSTPTSPVSPEAQDMPDQESELLFDMFSTGEVDFLRDADARHEAILPTVSDRFRAYEYAAMHWTSHYALSECIAEDSLREKARLLSQEGSWQLSNWYTFLLSATHRSLPALTEVKRISIAAMFGHTKNLQELLERGQSSGVNLTDALFWASCLGQSACAKVLLDHGVDPDVPKDQQTPLFVAAYTGHTKIVRMLIETRRVDINFKDRGGRTPLLVAAEQGHDDIAGLLLQQKNLRVDDMNHRGQTPFLVATASGSVNCLNIFIADGRVDVNHVDNSGRSALSIAAGEGLENVVKALLRIERMNLKSTDHYGRNALSYAAAKGQLPIVKYLIRSNLSISQSDENGRNAISWASNSAEAVATNHTGTSTLRYLIEKDREAAREPDKAGWPPLHWAMERPGYLEAVRALVEVGGVDVNHRDRTRRRSVLSWAAAEGYAEIVDYLLTIPNIEKNLPDEGGRTPLSYAATNGRLDVVRIFTKREHLDYRLPDSSGRTPLDWATLNGQEEVVEELKKLEGVCGFGQPECDQDGSRSM